MADKCPTYAVKDVFISGLIYKTRIEQGLPVLERTHEMIVRFCYKLGICYVDNRNIRRKHLSKDGLHLIESGKVILANNFLSYLSKCFLIRIQHPGGIYLDDDMRNTKLGISVSKSSTADLEMLQNDRLKLYINSLRNKLIDLGGILNDSPLGYLVISETKLDESFPNSQFKLNGYEVRARRDRHKHGGGLIKFVRQGFICKRLKKYEPNYSECICSEFTILKKKWICFSMYRPPSAENIKKFFEEINEVISKALCKYET